MFAAFLEWLGLEALAQALGDVFPVAALTALLAFPLAAGLMEGLGGNRLTYGGFAYYLVGAICLMVVWILMIAIAFWLFR